MHQEQVETIKQEVTYQARQEAALDCQSKLGQLEAMHQKALEQLKAEHHEAMVELEKELESQQLAKLSKLETEAKVSSNTLSSIGSKVG